MSPVLRAMMLKKVIDVDDERRANMAPEERKKSDEKFKGFAVIAAAVTFVGIMVMAILLFRWDRKLFTWNLYRK